MAVFQANLDFPLILHLAKLINDDNDIDDNNDDNNSDSDSNDVDDILQLERVYTGDSYF